MISGLFGLLALIFFIWMLVDCIQNTGLDSTKKIIWVLVILLVPIIGPLIYYFVGRGKA
jgi:hypothetical protein